MKAFSLLYFIQHILKLKFFQITLNRRASPHLMNSLITSNIYIQVLLFAYSSHMQKYTSFFIETNLKDLDGFASYPILRLILLFLVKLHCISKITFYKDKKIERTLKSSLFPPLGKRSIVVAFQNNLSLLDFLSSSKMGYHHSILCLNYVFI